MRMDEGLDTGPVLAQLEEPIRPDDDAGVLGDRLAQLGARLLLSVVRRLPDARPAGAHAGLRGGDPRPGHRAVRPGPHLERARRHARASRPGHGARTRGTHDLPGGRAKLVLASAVADDATGRPGTVLAHDARGVLVAAGTGRLRLLEVAPAGRRRMACGRLGPGRTLPARRASGMSA